jgi:hypothetical protein
MSNLIDSFFIDCKLLLFISQIEQKIEHPKNNNLKIVQFLNNKNVINK